MTVADGIAAIERLATSGPQLSRDERDEYDRICARVARAEASLRRADKRSDAAKRTTAERSLANARARLAEFLSPKVDHLWAPLRIVYRKEAHWSGPSGAGVHRWECEMVLERKDLAGPQYATVRVLKDESGPPTGARPAPGSMGVAWFAIPRQIENGTIVVLDAGGGS